MKNTGKIVLTAVIGLFGFVGLYYLYDWHAIPDWIPAILFFAWLGFLWWFYKFLPD